MQGYSASSWGDSLGAGDDVDWAAGNDEEPLADFLAELANGGSALDLGAGRGRVAIPLARRGVKVTAVDLSESALAYLKAAPGGEKVEIIPGNLVDVPAGGCFDVAYCVLNTFLTLGSQDEQVRCFLSTAKRLAPGGKFVLQTSCPDARQVAERQSVRTYSISAEEVILMAAKNDKSAQIFERQYISIREDKIRLYPIVFRYAWPSELDLMARIAGMSLAGRWGGWSGQPYTASGNCVSVYQREDATA